MRKERVLYLDTIKMFAIILVVFCHYVMLPFDSVFGNALMSFAWSAVPCFFMVTGYLMHGKESFCMYRHLKKIYHTYFCICSWKVLYLMFYCIITEVHFSKTELFNYIFLFGNINNVNVGHIWFMYAYMLALFFYPISYYIVNHNDNVMKTYTGLLFFMAGIGVYSVQFLCTVVARFLNINTINIKALLTVLPFSQYANVLFYFFVGGLIFKYSNEIDKLIQRKKYCIFAILCGILGNMIIKYFYTGSFQWQGIYLEDGYNRFSTLLMSVGFFMFIYSSKNNHKLDFLSKFIGEDTIGIYYLHMPILNLLNIYIYPHLQSYYSVSLNVVKTIFVIIICLLISKVVKKSSKRLIFDRFDS